MATRFLSEAAAHNEFDMNKTPSAQIILGRVNIHINNKIFKYDFLGT